MCATRLTAFQLVWVFQNMFQDFYTTTPPCLLRDVLKGNFMSIDVVTSDMYVQVLYAVFLCYT